MKAGDLQAAGVDSVLVFCVNDGAVMAAWKADQGIPDSSPMEFLADTQSALTEALGLRMDHPGPDAVLGAQTKRGKRAALFVEDNVIKVVEVSEGPDDPAGDGNPTASCVEHMLTRIKQL